MSSIRLFIIPLLFIFILFVIWVIITNNTLTVSRYQFYNWRLKQNVKIAHISDVHDSPLAKDVVKKLKEEKPDIIAITGDLLDFKPKEMYEFVENLTHIAPVYYVAGNHEEAKENYHEILKNIEQSGAIVLHDKTIEDKGLTLSGIEYSQKDLSMFKDLPSNKVNILLAHRPERVFAYKEYNFGYVLAGHAHCGQIILPLDKAVYAPNQGLFPDYFKGTYSLQGNAKTTLIVNAGVGGPKPRINNPPEICIINLKKIN